MLYLKKRRIRGDSINTPKARRILELDAFRGLCILGMILVHFLYDLEVFKQLTLELPVWISWAGRYGHVFFIVLSGICAVLSHDPFRRGTAVFAAALLVSYASFFGELVLGLPDARIWFGILHLLGSSMMLWPLVRRIRPAARFFLGVFLILLGLWFSKLTVSVPYLFPLGLCAESFFTGSDYFPVFPGIGWFLTGSCLGAWLYNSGASLFPKINWNFPPLHWLIFLGRHSLAVYLLHQPILLLLLLWL